MQLAASPVKQLALQHGVPVLQPATLKDPSIQQALANMGAEVMVVAAYGLILPQAVLRIPKRGCLNIHASLLPRWRGAAPIQRAILAGDTETGITIMQMDEGLDTGDMLLKKTSPITSEDTAASLHDKLAALGAQAIIEALRELERGTLVPEKQQESEATYAAKLNKSEALIDWRKRAAEIERAVRAYFPFPVAHTVIGETPIKILQAAVSPSRAATHGTILSIEREAIHVACGEGTLALKVLQKPGGKPLPAAQFVQGFPLKVGDRFGVAES